MSSDSAASGPPAAAKPSKPRPPAAPEPGDAEPGRNGHAEEGIAVQDLHGLLEALLAVRIGDFSVRLPGERIGLMGKIADSFNDIVAANQRLAQQIERVGQVVGREGKTRQRVKLGRSSGGWGAIETAANSLIDDLLRPTTEVTRAIAAVAKGDLLQTVALDVDGRPLKGEFLRSANIVNTMIKQLNAFASEVTCVAREAEERRSMLLRELDHRAKNMLAVVQSVLHLSKADTIGEFTQAVGGRIQALSRAHALLSESRWQGVELGRIVDEEIVPFRGPDGAQNGGTQVARIQAGGPAVSVPPSTAQSLAVALHELTTNAARYGALSQPGGRVALRWALEPEGLVLRWSEQGGPAVAAPSRRGFGTRVIAASVEHQLGGKARFDWRPEGLMVELTIPPAQIGAQRQSPPPPPQASEAGKLALMAPAGTQILLVEDEALIGAMFKELLTELGFQVVGPIADLAAGLAAAAAEIRGAILDINLGRERTYPIADMLAARCIPFVFVTGCNPGDVDRRFAAIPILEKPLEPGTLRRLFAGGRLNLPDKRAGGAPLAS